MPKPVKWLIHLQMSKPFWMTKMPRGLKRHKYVNRLENDHPHPSFQTTQNNHIGPHRPNVQSGGYDQSHQECPHHPLDNQSAIFNQVDPKSKPMRMISVTKQTRTTKLTLICKLTLMPKWPWNEQPYPSPKPPRLTQTTLILLQLRWKLWFKYPPSATTLILSTTN